MNVRSKYNWVLSNIAAVPECNKKFMEMKHMWPKVIELARKDPKRPVRLEALWVLTNLITKGSSGTTYKLCYNRSTIKILVEYQRFATDPALTKNVLEALDKILTVSANHSFMKEVFLDNDGTDVVAELQQSENDEIYKVAIYILETHFDFVESSAEDQNIAPALAPDGKTFAFSAREQLFGEETPTALTTNNDDTARVELGDHSNMEF